jgi:hypothetical protein
MFFHRAMVPSKADLVNPYTKISFHGNAICNLIGQLRHDTGHALKNGLLVEPNRTRKGG